MVLLKSKGGYSCWIRAGLYRYNGFWITVICLLFIIVIISRCVCIVYKSVCGTALEFDSLTTISFRVLLVEHGVYCNAVTLFTCHLYRCAQGPKSPAGCPVVGIWNISVCGACYHEEDPAR